MAPATPTITATAPAVLFLCYSDEKLVLLDSMSKTYHTFAFSAKDGAELWRRFHGCERRHSSAPSFAEKANV